MKKDETVYRGAKKTQDMPLYGPGEEQRRRKQELVGKDVVERTNPSSTKPRREELPEGESAVHNRHQTVGKHKKD